MTLSSAAWANDVDNAAYSVLTSVAGTNTITATGPANYAYGATKHPLFFIPAATNTGATTINVTPSGASALGAKNIFCNGAALAGGELRIGIPAAVLYDGTQFQLLNPIGRKPTRTVLTTGSDATYTTPSGATRIDVQVQGGGSGGMGGNAGAASGAAAASSFTDGSVTLTANGGAAGVNTGGAVPAAVTASGGDINIPGASGSQGAAATASGNVSGVPGANSFFGGGGAASYNATSIGAGANSGSAGCGGFAGTAGTTSGASGNTGAYCRKLITSPSASYTYTVGNGSNGTSGGSGAGAGSNGSAGIIIIDEFYD